MQGQYEKETSSLNQRCNQYQQEVSELRHQIKLQNRQLHDNGKQKHDQVRIFVFDLCLIRTRPVFDSYLILIKSAFDSYSISIRFVIFHCETRRHLILGLHLSFFSFSSLVCNEKAICVSFVFWCLDLKYYFYIVRVRNKIG